MRRVTEITFNFLKTMSWWKINLDRFQSLIFLFSNVISLSELTVSLEVDVAKDS